MVCVRVKERAVPMLDAVRQRRESTPEGVGKSEKGGG